MNSRSDWNILLPPEGTKRERDRKEHAYLKCKQTSNNRAQSGEDDSLVEKKKLK